MRKVLTRIRMFTFHGQARGWEGGCTEHISSVSFHMCAAAIAEGKVMKAGMHSQKDSDHTD